MNNSLSQAGETYFFDALVIGSGLAGLHYALTLQRLNPKTKIAIVSKQKIGESNSQYAQGGIAAYHIPEDKPEHHITDTLKAGDGLCYETAVKHFITRAPEAIKSLQAFYHIHFDRLDDQSFSLAKEGGHSHRRIFHCGDKTGLTITSTLVSIAEGTKGIHLLENNIAVNLITQSYPHQPSYQTDEVIGAYVLDCQTNKIHTILASAVVLASGGTGKIYRYTSNSMVATGDGTAMACRAGARVGNMEFYQFHPTLLYHRELTNFLISEAVRGEGAFLRRVNDQQRFMANYEPDAKELATRDLVARAIFNEIERSEHDYVYLDITHKSSTFLKKRFPKIFDTLKSVGIDMGQDMIPVVPAAHYQCGGIITDVHGRTDLRRLYAIGEVACSGLHGANRLASNSLLEAILMANNAAKTSLKDISSPSIIKQTPPVWDSPQTVNPRRASQINAHWHSIRGEMTSYAGIIRTEAGLADLLTLIRKRRGIIEEYYWNHTISRDFIELRNIILNAELIVRAALSRRESRGGHFREDFPEKYTVAQESIERLSQVDMI